MRPATTFRRARAVLAAAALALLLVACATAANTGDPTVAAVVNGEQVPISTVERRFESAKANPQVAQQLEGDDGGVARQLQAQILSQLIRFRLLEQGARADFGIAVDQTAVDDKRDEIIEQVGGQQAFDQVVAENRLTPEDLDEQLRELVYQERVQERLTEDVDVPRADIAQAYEQSYGGEFPNVRHILVESEAEAQDVLRRLQAGEDFAAVASEVSIDPGSGPQGGDLGQIRPGQTVPEFEEAVFAAAPGQLVGPVQTQFGFHVIQVVPAPALQEVEDDLRDQLLEQRRAEALRAWLGEKSAAADVTVNPRFGAWDPASGQVAPRDPLGAVTEAPAGPTEQGS